MLQQQAVISWDGKYVIDCSRLEFADLLTPSSSVSPVFANCLGEAIEAEKLNMVAELQSRRCIATSEAEKLCASAEYLTDIRRLIKPLSDVGKELLRLQQEADETQPKLPKVSDCCDVQQCRIPYRGDGADVQKAELLKLQQHRSIKPDTTNSLPKLDPNLILQAISNYTGQWFLPSEIPIFLGYVNSDFADDWAKLYGFIESYASLNFEHGDIPHLLQLALLKVIVGLDSGTVQTLVENDLWGYFLDKNQYASNKERSLTSDNEHFRVIGHNMALFANSPVVIHEKLSTGVFSEALETLANRADIDSLIPELSDVLGIPDLNKEQLTEMVTHLRVLELAVTNRAIEAQKELTQRLPNTNIHSANRCLSGDFEDGNPTIIRSLRLQALKHLEEGKHVYGYSKREKFVGLDHREFYLLQNKYIPITDEDDIEKCDSFVVLPKGSPRLKDLPWHVLQAQSEK
ncbi:hypothetical protein [Parashewanella tropica]|uniref:hypothetical protein n=1 Tax=Parashewanella tropica TaxID=2547970 RepID=UPI0010599A86|nr:hypothetical protein [Parashewanella tropica]